jgi:hypothetical protein
MKIAELNIGLSSRTLGEISAENVLSLLKAESFQIITFRIVESISNDGKELCLAVKVECPEGWQDKLADIAAYFGQDCITVVGFIGHEPYDTFIKKLWVTPDEKQHIVELEEKTVYPWNHSDLVGICKWEAARIRALRFKNQIGGGKFNA